MRFDIIDRGGGIKWATLSSESYTFDNFRNISVWCNEHGCGKQVNVHAFSFKNEEELSMFLLRWQT